MKRNLLPMLAAIGAFAALPALAQPNQPTQNRQSQNQEDQMLKNRPETVPLQLKARQIMQLQQKLNQKGFDAGPSDGHWGPQTSQAIRDFQVKKGYQPTGRLDQRTASALGISMTAPQSKNPPPNTQAQGYGASHAQAPEQSASAPDGGTRHSGADSAAMANPEANPANDNATGHNNAATSNSQNPQAPQHR